MGFIFDSIRILDIVDILLVAFLLYQLYKLIRGTVAINIFAGIFILYLFSLLVDTLGMRLLHSILSQFIGLGVIALIIVFQQEVRRFLLIIGTRYFGKDKLTFENLFSAQSDQREKVNITAIDKACRNMAKTKTGALIVIAKKSELRSFVETGDIINSDTSSRLLETLFYKNNPLHDGAVIIVKNRIRAAKCVLPVSDNPDLDPNLGMRHKAALGMSENTDSFVIVVSEQTGLISIFNNSKIEIDVEPEKLKRLLEKEFLKKEKKSAYADEQE
ncbi:diadenylate cyclase CdaA [Bacteroidota bacterium]